MNYDAIDEYQKYIDSLFEVDSEGCTNTDEVVKDNERKTKTLSNSELLEVNPKPCIPRETKVL